jgi:hypothetical protein
MGELPRRKKETPPVENGSELLTLERHRHRHRAIKKLPYCATPEGVEVTAEVLIQPLTDFLVRRIDGYVPPLPPDELNDRLGRVPDPYPAVALAILAPLLDAMARGWEGFDDPYSWRMLLAKQMGRTLCDWLVLKEAEASGDQPLIPGRGAGALNRSAIICIPTGRHLNASRPAIGCWKWRPSWTASARMIRAESVSPPNGRIASIRFAMILYTAIR